MVYGKYLVEIGIHYAQFQTALRTAILISDEALIAQIIIVSRKGSSEHLSLEQIGQIAKKLIGVTIKGKNESVTVASPTEMTGSDLVGGGSLDPPKKGELGASSEIPISEDSRSVSPAASFEGAAPDGDTTGAVASAAASTATPTATATATAPPAAAAAAAAATAATDQEQLTLTSLFGIEDVILLEDAASRLFTDWPLQYVNSNIPDAKMHFWHTTTDPKVKMATKAHAFYGNTAGWIQFPPINLKHSVTQLGITPSVPYRISNDLQESGPNLNLDASETLSECDEISESVAYVQSIVKQTRDTVPNKLTPKKNN